MTTKTNPGRFFEDYKEQSSIKGASRGYLAGIGLTLAILVVTNLAAGITGEALLAFGPHLPKGAEKAVRVLNLSPAADLVEAAANLFSDLRTLDDADAKSIAVMRVPLEGLGEAINDRLARAAAPRDI